jgi:hypothetical protein
VKAELAETAKRHDIDRTTQSDSQCSGRSAATNNRPLILSTSERTAAADRQTSGDRLLEEADNTYQQATGRKPGTEAG